MLVQLFVTCLVDNLFPQIADAVVTVLERHGVRVAVPQGQTCCGQPAFNAGYTHEARQMATHFLGTFMETEGLIVCPSGSCTAMIMHHYPRLFADDEVRKQQSEVVAGRIREFSQFLVHDLGLTAAGGVAGTYTYHPSCHLTRDLGLGACAEVLMDHIPNAKRVPLPEADACCGFGGLFAVKMPAISAALMKRKLANIAASEADACVVCDASCMMHLNGGLIQQGNEPIVKHLAQILVAENHSQTR